MNDRLNRAVEQLLLDDRFLRRFRREPERALGKLGLTHEEVAAVKRGNADELVGLGLDPTYVWAQERGGFLHAWIVRHTKRLTPALVLAAFLLPAAPAVAGRRIGMRRAHARRASRMQARAMSLPRMRSEKVRRLQRAMSRSTARS